MSDGRLRTLLIEDNMGDADLLVEMLAGEEQSIHIDRVECMSRGRNVSQGNGRRRRDTVGSWVARQRRARVAREGQPHGAACFDRCPDRSRR